MAKLKDGFRGSRAIVLPESIVQKMSMSQFGSKLYITDIGYYPKARHHFRKREKGAPEFILIYCVEGKGWCQSDSRQYTIAAGQFVILPSGKPHSYGSDENDPWTIYWLHFNGELADFYSNGHNTPTKIGSGDLSRNADRLAIFEGIYNTLENGYTRKNVGYCLSLLYYFLGSIKYADEFCKPLAGQEYGNDIVDRTVRYMRENIEKKLTLDELCAYLGYSRSYFSGMFKRKTGYSPMKYFIQLKMQTACNMLDFTNMRINQICHKTGIEDPYSFTRSFTKTIGYSPSHYRKIRKG